MPSASATPDVLPAQTPPTAAKLWRPRRVLITPDALLWPHGRAILDRAANLGAEVIHLKSNRLPSFSPPRPKTATDPEPTPDKSAQLTYANAKTTLAIVTAPPGQRKLQPIPPSADWQFHLAQGCPAHCQYCYLAGSLAGPPVTRAYANLPEILDALQPFAGQGAITSRPGSPRAHEGTTFEASCYTDPLGIEHLTGSLAETIRYFGQWRQTPNADSNPSPDLNPSPHPPRNQIQSPNTPLAHVQLRFTTKFDAVQPLLHLPHNGQTRVRFSVNAHSVAHNFEGGTASVSQRLQAMRQMALAGYPIGLTIAPIMPVPNWQSEYTSLLQAAALALDGIPSPDLTAELITHRFTPGSKEVLLGWYPRTTLDLAESNRSEKRTKFGGFKYVYPKDPMRELRDFFHTAIPQHLPTCQILYWT